MKNVKTQTVAALFTIATWIGTGTVAYHFLEKWSYIDSFYFSVTTLTTVGYGDMTPTTDASKLFTSIFILTGVSVVVASLGIIGSTHISKRTIRFVRHPKKKRKR